MPNHELPDNWFESETVRYLCSDGTLRNAADPNVVIATVGRHIEVGFPDGE